METVSLSLNCSCGIIRVFGSEISICKLLTEGNVKLSMARIGVC
jgi:hypothetical protein